MNIHEIKDFYLCGTLLIQGFRLVDQNRENGFTVFSFEDTNKLRKTISEYYLGKLRVDPSVYGLTLRQLKGLMHNGALVSTQTMVTNNEFTNTKGTK
ncbi:MAG: DUF5659 domain-containing protein [Ignavibacteria bacterium]|nr:DUF5659 domain-containing protein [Ignavibacteria bacterium]